MNSRHGSSGSTSNSSSSSDSGPQSPRKSPTDEPIRIEQFVQEVLDFSSQYGSDDSISFTADNIIGGPCMFPEYGDFSETFAMRSYGTWWQRAPSRAPEFMPQTIPEIVSQDYIIVQFEESVLPEQVSVFENYNPGAVVQIWAFSILGEWHLLWQDHAHPVPQCARIFSPPLRKMSVPTRIIRLDFNHDALDYFTEIDAILLSGVKFASPFRVFRPLEMQMPNGCKRGRIQRRLDRLRFQPKPAIRPTDASTVLSELLATGLKEFVPDELCSDGDEPPVKGLQSMPYEILVNICGYLDLVSLFRLAETCRLLRDVSCDPILYTEINLRPYWNLVNDTCLATLQTRCRLLKKLDMSWCCSAGGLEPAHFISFMRHCGRQQTHLRLNSISFLVPICINAVSQFCTNLKELTLRNSGFGYTVTPQTFAALCHLERLDLYRTTFPTATLSALVQQNPNLKHLNLGQNNESVNMDEVAWLLPTSCKQLVSIDLWKTHGLTAIGLAALANCSRLQEVELGWCLRQEPAPGESLKILLKECASLQRLGLASVRGLTADDLDAIAVHGGNIVQLELMGILGLTTDHCLELLRCCKRLRLLDISFCENIDDLQVACWREMFPVDIKRGVRASSDRD